MDKHLARLIVIA